MQRQMKLMSWEVVMMLMSQLRTTAELELSWRRLMSAQQSETPTAYTGTPCLLQRLKIFGA